MPELPEVQTVVAGLKKLLIGHIIDNIETDWPKSLIANKSQIKKFVVKSQIINLWRKGKVILIDLSSQYTFAIHLKLTGQLVYRQKEMNQLKNFGAGHPSDSLISHLPDKTTRVIFTLNNNAQLFFNDMRKFGWIKLIETPLLSQEDFVKRLGPDALTVSHEVFINLLSKRSKNIKACLLDQTIISGCGNIYADESLWMSRIHPRKLANQLTKNQLKLLCVNLKNVLEFSIKQGGSSSKNYINAEGEKGKYLDFVNVYQQTGLPCKRCNINIKRIIVAGRGTHICESCQK